MLNVPVITVAKWEAGDRKPSGAALRLLEIAKHSPEFMRKVPKSEIVRERLIRATAKNKAGKPSLWNQMADLVLPSDSLPADLSSNKAHLKGYGKKRPH